jgi:tRNA nucleotidyltransferase (CCA-adding enzyme)
LPSVERGSIKLDLHRRDFTINTLAMRLDHPYRGQVLDYWGGERDLREKKIRVLHSLSFIDDPTRILRAIRLEQRLGFEIESRTMELLLDAVALLDRVSGERICSELDAIFPEAHCLAALGRLNDLKILGSIEEGLDWDAWLRKRFEAAKSFVIPAAWSISVAPELSRLLYTLWLIRLDAGQIDAVSRRLHFPGVLKADILEAHRLCEFLGDLSGGFKVSEVVERLEDSREGSLIACYLALEQGSEGQGALKVYLTRWRSLHPVTNGDDLKARGLPPGPRYREILWRLRAAWLDGVLEHAADEEKLLEQLLRMNDHHA